MKKHTYSKQKVNINENDDGKGSDIKTLWAFFNENLVHDLCNTGTALLQTELWANRHGQAIYVDQ